MINSISLDNQSISASIISAQQNLNDKLNSIDILLQSFNSDLNNINDTVLYFVDELKAISNQVITLVDDTIEIVECNQSYDSSWKIKLPPDMVDTITDTLTDIEDNLENIEIEDIGNICTNIYGSCTVGHNTISPTEPTFTDIEEGTMCINSYCSSTYIGPDGECSSCYCVRSYSDSSGEGFCRSNHCGDYDTVVSIDGIVVCPSEHAGPGVVCNGGYVSETGGKECKSYYANTDGKTCQVNYTEDTDGEKECTGYSTDGGGLCRSYTETSDGEKNCTSYSAEDGESCGMYSSDNGGTTSCTNDYAKGDATCEALYGYTEGGGDSCLATFSTDVGSCTGFSSDGTGTGDRTCVSDYNIGGEVQCSSGYKQEGDTVLCVSGVQSGTCTSNVGSSDPEQPCTFNAGCSKCYSSNFHQDCPQMGCWDIQVPE